MFIHKFETMDVAHDGTINAHQPGETGFKIQVPVEELYGVAQPVSRILLDD